MGKIHLVCLRERNKLKVKIHKYIDNGGKEYFDLYDTTYNCRFPKFMREEIIFMKWKKIVSN